MPSTNLHVMLLSFNLSGSTIGTIENANAYVQNCNKSQIIPIHMCLYLREQHVILIRVNLN
jgi:hypothetical protein